MKKIMCLLFAALLLFGAIPVVASAENYDLSGIADGGIYAAPDGNEYTVLRSADTIKSIVTSNMAGNYILGNDIDFGGKLFYTYIFSDGNGTPFSGIFNGNGYALKNFRTNANFNAKVGLVFGSLSGYAKICDLTVGEEGNHIRFDVTSKSATVVGGFVGYTVAGAKATISGVKVYADLSYSAVVNQSVYIGGIIGDSDPITITDTEFHGSLKITEEGANSDYVTLVGGIVGRYGQDGGTLSITNCKNYAELDTTNRKLGTKSGIRTVLGGILGYAKYPFSAINCENHGDIYGDKNVGGIVGEVVGQKSTDYAYEMIGCRNYGNIEGEMNVGGILGIAATDASSQVGVVSTYSVNILNCLNVADITGKTLDANYVDNGATGVGGIAGRINRGYTTVENCGSIGDIKGTGKRGTSMSTTSGIVGTLLINNDTERFAAIVNCYAVGTLTPRESTFSCSATAAIYTDKMAYLPFISNCYYSLEMTQGKLKAVGLDKTVTEDYGDYKYVAPEAVDMTAISDGTLLSKLGAGFVQTVGTDAYPIPVQAELETEETTGNLFVANAKGYYDANGNFVSDSEYSARNKLKVSTGDVVTIGAFSTSQKGFVHLFNGEGVSQKGLTLSDMTLVADLGGGYGIYSYTVPEGVGYISVSVFTRRSYITLLTLNSPFDKQTFLDYFGIDVMKGSDSSPLWQKSALFLGDSICYGFDDVAIGNVRRAYAGRVAYDYDMTWVNAGVSGATLSTVTDRKLIVDQMSAYKNQKFDYVVIEGGINDALNKVAIGEISKTIYSGLDTTTYAGALEYLFREVTKAYPNAKVGFMITYQCPRNASHETYITYQDITKEICEKWDIEYLDMFGSENINEVVLESSNKNSTYMPDGIHPSATGYDRLSPLIADFMETLSVPDPTNNNGGDSGSGDQNDPVVPNDPIPPVEDENKDPSDD